MIRARVVLASAYRRTSQHDAASAEYREAQKVADSGDVSDKTLVLLGQRRSVLLASLGRLTEALEVVDDVLEGQGPEPSTMRLNTMVRRGYMLNELAEVADSKRAARELAGRAAIAAEEVLAAVEPGESPLAERIHYCAVHNLANAPRRLRVADTWKALGYIREARKLLKGQRSRTCRARLDWVEALVWNRLGMHAERSGVSRSLAAGLSSFDYRGRSPW